MHCRGANITMTLGPSQEQKLLVVAPHTAIVKYGLAMAG